MNLPPEEPTPSPTADSGPPVPPPETPAPETAGATGWIGFPPPLLGPEAVRLPILAWRDGLLILDKPAGVAISGYLQAPGETIRALTVSINEQLRRGKPELTRLGLSPVQAFLPLEAELSGLAPLASGPEAVAHWRNAHGSGQMRFVFSLLARGGPLTDTFALDLPVSAPGPDGRVAISHRHGRKCETLFERRERLGEYSLWEATSDFLRPHQIRVHAGEAGLLAVGESFYGKSPPVLLSQIRRRYRGREEERPLYDGLCLHLQRITVNLPGAEPWSVTADWPRRWRVLLDRLRRHE